MATTTTWANAPLYMADFQKTFDKGWSDAIARKAAPPADPSMSAAYDAGFKATAGTSDQMMRSEYQTAAQSLAMRGFQIGFDPNPAAGLDPQIATILSGFPDRTSAQEQNLVAVYFSARASATASKIAIAQGTPNQPVPKSKLVNNLVAGGIFLGGLAAAGLVITLVFKKRPDEATLQPTG